MKPHIFNIPQNLDFEDLISFQQELNETPVADLYIFNFETLKWSKPLGMLYLCELLKDFKKKHPESRRQAHAHESRGYEAHMGMFQAFGLNHGNKPGEAKGSNTYLPITKLDVEDIKEQASFGTAAGAVIEEDTHRLAHILTRTDTGPSYDVIQYALQEILRNTVEHSKSDEVWYCAQYLPSTRVVEMAIIDRGIGISGGLSNNPHLILPNEETAIKTAILPGVSGKAFKGSKQKKRPDGWHNSGYGLYMTYRLCRATGHFLLASNGKALSINEESHTVLEGGHSGTAVRLYQK